MESPTALTNRGPDRLFQAFDEAYRLLRRDVSANEKKTASAIPTVGAYTIGDFVWHTAPTIDVNDMVLLGWSRLTTGSDHVSGTDWALAYVSHVSPAT